MKSQRIKSAIEFLKDGQSFRVDDLRLGVADDGIYVTGWSQYLNLENVTKEQSLIELSEIKSLFKLMVDSSPELEEFIRTKKIKINLAFNYGASAIGICSEKDGVITWELERFK